MPREQPEGRNQTGGQSVDRETRDQVVESDELSESDAPAVYRYSLGAVQRRNPRRAARKLQRQEPK
ncbi:MAG: hypothetical protein DMG59_04490 [Acidobacteria bacterium]|nr:MAG: hypothetical protein DMG59_04490 [Acidobacteriota bacterium]